ncbi:hypothetical protein A9Q83_08010 [Alphaproteobacteria bacterium 46_93_T64]|nr:hypothetical protein A9Q83_08010 [Alphaproteobacteria bacterium 46_93_T64]
MSTINGKESAPRVGCGALIENESGEILLVKRKRAPEKDHWGFPGGKVDFGETAERATIREISEELGVSIDLQGLAHLVEYIDTEDNQHWMAPVYRAKISFGVPTIKEPEALSDYQWFSLNNMPALLTQATLQTLNIKKG